MEKIYKDPKTDDGTKKSQKGKVAVYKKDGQLIYEDMKDWNFVDKNDLLETIYENGVLVKKQTLNEIRNRVGKI